jgi:hypothetical protein
MGNGNRDGSGQWQWQQQWVMATATAMATAMETATATETATAISMATATAMATMTKGGLPLHVPAMCSTVAGAKPCLHPHGHIGVCIHQCFVMGVSLQRVFAPFQGGGLLTAHHGLFSFFFTTTVQFTEQPSVCPPHYSGAQEPCLPIDALPPPLLFHIFAKVCLGGAWIVCLQHAALWQG